MRIYQLIFVLLTACAVEGSGTSDCSCDVSYNGVSKTLACGTTDCVNGQSYTCGASADISSGGTCSAPPGATFDCHGQTCDAATQYCILSKYGDFTAASACAPLPGGCTSCGCLGSADAAWQQANNGGNNCTAAVVVCAASEGAVTVTCQK